MILSLASLLLYFCIQPPSKTSSSLGLPYSPIVGKEVSLTQAQASVPYKINLPTSLGQYAMIKLDKDTNATTIVFASKKPVDDANFIDILNGNAIVLLEMPNKMTLDASTQNIADAISATKNDVGGLQPVTINGYSGCAGGNVWHTVTWYTETTYYQLTSNIDYPLQQLVSVANNIPLK